MLNFQEITELETAWQRFDSKRRKKRRWRAFAVALAFLLAGLAAAIYSYYGAKPGRAAEHKSAANNALIDQLERAKTRALKQKELAKKAAAKEQQVPAAPAAPAAKEQQVPAAPAAEPSAEGQKVQIKISSATTAPAAPTASANLATPAPAAPATLAQKAPAPQNPSNQADKVASTLEKIAFLKRQFKANNSQHFAVDLAELYLEINDPKKAQFWALKANALDDNNERSWMAFARSKAALGQRSAAVQVLSAYLEKSPGSSAARRLLEQIKNTPAPAAQAPSKTPPQGRTPISASTPQQPQGSTASPALAPAASPAPAASQK